MFQMFEEAIEISYLHTEDTVVLFKGGWEIILVLWVKGVA